MILHHSRNSYTILDLTSANLLASNISNKNNGAILEYPATNLHILSTNRNKKNLVIYANEMQISGGVS